MRKSRLSRKKSRANIVYNNSRQNEKKEFIKGRFNVYSNEISIKPSSSGVSHDQSEYDTIGCSMISYAEVNNWWINMIKENKINTKSLQEIFLTNYKEKNPTDATDHTGINIMCLDRITDSTDKKIEKILLNDGSMPSIQPGLNVLISCYSTRVAVRLNNDETYGNKNGYYYIGFENIIFFVNNVILMPNKDNKFEYNFVDFSTTNISNSLTEKIKLRLNKFRDHILTSSPPSTYFTKINILTILRKIAEAITSNIKITNSMVEITKRNGTVFTTMEQFQTDIDGTEIDPTEFIDTTITTPILAKSHTSPSKSSARSVSTESSASKVSTDSTESSASTVSTKSATPTHSESRKTTTRKLSRSLL